LLSFSIPQAIKRKVNIYIEIEVGNLDQWLYLGECEQTLPTKLAFKSVKVKKKQDKVVTASLNSTN
jgi:hypothetical protein